MDESTKIFETLKGAADRLSVEVPDASTMLLLVSGEERSGLILLGNPVMEARLLGATLAKILETAESHLGPEIGSMLIMQAFQFGFMPGSSNEIKREETDLSHIMSKEAMLTAKKTLVELMTELSNNLASGDSSKMPDLLSIARSLGSAPPAEEETVDSVNEKIEMLKKVLGK